MGNGTAVLGRSNRKPDRARAAIIVAGVGVLAFAAAELLPWVQVPNPRGGPPLTAVLVIQMDGTAVLLYQLFLPVLLALTGRAIASRNEGGLGAAGSAIGMACGVFILLLGVLAGPVTLSGSSDVPPTDTHTDGYGPGAI